jgi:hypothetical protein
MNKNWIKHFVKHHLDEMASKSLRNCHARGVDSILFDDTPGARIRLFVAHRNHELWKNSPMAQGNNEMSVGYHPHHCDLTLHVVQGVIANITATKHVMSFGRVNVNRYLYKSQIANGECRFELEQEKALLYVDGMRVLTLADSTLFMPAQQIHTIAVDSNCPAAWFVYEGKEDPEYKPICYSNQDLTRFNAEGMYQPMDASYMCELLRSVFGDLQ